MNDCSFVFTGNEKIVIKELFHTIYNSFTYELWVKPEEIHQIDQESQEGDSGLQGKKYVIAPGHGRDVQKAGVGVSIGTNGVSVYEHSDDYLPAVLVHQMEISDWVHVAVVYNEKTPYLFINGELVKDGLTSPKEIVCASGVFGAHDLYGSFVGQVGEIRLWNYARTKEQIREHVNFPVNGDEYGLFGYWKFDQRQEVMVKDQTIHQNHGEIGWVHYLEVVLNGENESGFQEITNSKLLKPVNELLSSFEKAANQREKQGILFVCNRIGGGSEYYLDKYIQEVQHDARVYRLMLEYGIIYVEDYNYESHRFFSLRIENLDQGTLDRLLRLFGIDLIYINHLIQFPLFQFMKLIQHSNIPYVYFIHDYFSACPRHQLVNKDGVYCGGETNMDICRSCLGNHPEDIKAWRDHFSSFLNHAKGIFAPSRSTKEIIQNYYPNISVEVKEHSLSNKIYHTFKPEFAYKEVLNIAFLGYFHDYKGLRILYNVWIRIKRENLPIHVKVIGYTNIHLFPFETKDQTFLVTGKYDKEEISDLLAQHEVAAVIIPSICPETFSYTTSEAMLSGYPVITFNLGAPAERVERTGGGWVVESIEGEEIVNVLKSLLSNRDEIVEKANHLSLSQTSNLGV